MAARPLFRRQQREKPLFLPFQKPIVTQKEGQDTIVPTLPSIASAPFPPFSTLPPFSHSALRIAALLHERTTLFNHYRIREEPATKTKHIYKDRENSPG